ncbi:MAG: prepilin-type N-terminal cleavage/methylation domain-containing protein [Verrucomicrobiae bacterium]|nr:prepilin-type N-terminal cleavage/methylation domain-containing protein [Verrucomicrobiae bacterium]
MKLQGQAGGGRGGRAVARWGRAFTLPELMITGAILAMLLGAVISGHLFGLRYLRLIEVAAATNESDRRLLRLLANDMATAVFWEIGSGTESSFSRLGLNRLQQANALQIYYVQTNAAQTQFTRYYLSANEDMLYRYNSQDKAPQLLSTSIINSGVFTMEDAAGNILSNRIQQPVLGVNIQFRDFPQGTWGLARDKETHWVRARFKTRTAD